MSAVMRHVSVRGRVQGVGYRAWIAETALRHNLEGWVRNRRDGAVEAVFSGPENAVAAMISDCHRGPRASRVETVFEEAGSADLLSERRPGERFSVLSTV